LDQVTQPPYQPPNQPPSPPGYPPAYGPAYGYPPAYSAPAGEPPPGPPAHRTLLWAWIGFVVAAVVAFGLFAGFAVQWTLAASRLGQPDNTWATYGIVTAVQGSDLQVHVADGAPLVKRTETRVFNRTSTSTATTHVDGSFDSTVTGAPAKSVGSAVSFTFTKDSTQGTYLAVAPSRIKKVGTVPPEIGVAFLVGLILGVVGLILFIRWVVALRRNRRPAAPMYSAPPSYWPPSPQQR
jgi:hypothetical protein